MDCRICFDSTEEKVISPCECDGSMKWVHKSCLEKWIHHSGNITCPVCKSKFIIEKSSRDRFLTYLLHSKTFTTFLTIIFGMMIISLSVIFHIRFNTLLIVCFMIVFGIHYIQVYFNHEELNLDLIFETITLYSANPNMDASGLAIIYWCLWFLVDNAKFKVITCLIN
tara:strand:+ start:11713 stop:12216 length:504 start_codon:yes stop_codon:yes gene_type:complete